MSLACLEVVSINGQASIQDLGRFNAQHLGFSAGGAADEFAFLHANRLIAARYHATENITDKQHNYAALEITLGQIHLKAHSACTIAITGADCNAKINNIAAKNWQCYQLAAGDIIYFSMPKTGLHSYLAVQGGFTCEAKQQPWLGSFAQTGNEMALGFTDKPLTAGSKLYFSGQSQKSTELVAQTATSLTSAYKQFYSQGKLTLRMMPSALFLQMDKHQQQAFLTTEYVISADSNRMGYRLIADHSQKVSSNEKILSESLRRRCLLSRPVSYGMVQFPTNEQPIILMKERQTMGGYPVLGTIMQTDLFRLSQMRPGEKVCFSLIKVQQAQQQLIAFREKFTP
ncbi:MAG: biotin-dependent carboxyltransferase family protein [Cognaticolwellia sp.]